MKIYIKFIVSIFIKSFIFISLILFSLVFILNLLSEIDFFKDLDVGALKPIYFTFLNSPASIFEMLPFIFLLTTQMFFISILKDNQFEIFKYSGIKNFTLIKIIAIFSLILGFFLIIFFYNISSNLKNFYLSLKSPYTTDDKYLAVITKNGLWIKDKIDQKTLIINSKEIKNNFLINTFITVFDDNYEIIKNIQSEKIDIKDNNWLIYNPKIFVNNDKIVEDLLIINSNFNYEKIQTLFSNLSSLSILELQDLKKNYKQLGYSTVEIDLQILKLLTFPIYFMLLVIFTSIIMLNFKRFKNNTFKISFGLFLSVIIYYINNFFYVLGATEKISINISIVMPLAFLFVINFIFLDKINEK